jgi:hypothetical protein
MVRRHHLLRNLAGRFAVVVEAATLREPYELFEEVRARQRSRTILTRAFVIADGGNDVRRHDLG